VILVSVGLLLIIFGIWSLLNAFFRRFLPYRPSGLRRIMKREVDKLRELAIDKIIFDATQKPAPLPATLAPYP
jgi:hypothetical protein